MSTARDRRAFYSPLLTTETSSAQPHVCRVCRGDIEAGAPVLFRAWHVEYSHVECGWLRHDEYEPHERTRPGTFSGYWEWRCPTCLRDACSVRQPDEATERRCGRCAPEQYTVALGARVELVQSVRLRRRRGSVEIARGTRAHVREVKETAGKGQVRVTWVGVSGPDEWLPASIFVRV